MSKILVLKNEAPPVGAGNAGLSDLFSTGLAYLTGAQIRQRADELGLTDPEREKFSAAQKRARMLGNLYGAGKGLQYLGRGYLRGRLSPIESAMQGLQNAQMAGATLEPMLTRRTLSNIEAARAGQEDEVGRVAVKPPVEEMLRPQTPAETRQFGGVGVRERPMRGSAFDELLQYYPSSRPVVEERQMTFSPEITGGLPSPTQQPVKATPTMTDKQVAVLSQQTFPSEIIGEKAEPTVREKSSNQLTEPQLQTILSSFDKTNYQDLQDEAQRNQPDFSRGANSSRVQGS